ncbi:hypothetical protein EDC01DRAFT_497497 [Geopyxis carbonaria]|nr:hypothetical protein EDC01DRAFT_497497 [Geopyxis carbonaria]
MRSIRVGFEQIFRKGAPTHEKKKELEARHGELFDILRTAGITPTPFVYEEVIGEIARGEKEEPAKKKIKHDNTDAKITAVVNSEEAILMSLQLEDTPAIEPESPTVATIKTPAARERPKRVAAKPPTRARATTKRQRGTKKTNSLPSPTTSKLKPTPIKCSKTIKGKLVGYQSLSYTPGDVVLYINHYPEIQRRVGKMKPGPRRAYLYQKPLSSERELDVARLILVCRKEEKKNRTWPVIKTPWLARNLRLCQNSKWKGKQM